MHDEWIRPGRRAGNFGFRTRWTANPVRSPFFFRTSRDFSSFLLVYSLFIFLIFFLFFIIIIVIVLRLLEVTAKKWKSIKRRISPMFQVLPPWRAAKSGSISFKIRTNEPNGLIMYSRSGAHTRVCEFRSIYLFFLLF